MSDLGSASATLAANLRVANWSRDERVAASAPMREAYIAQFGAVVDRAFPDLDPEERAFKVKKLRSAYFAKIRRDALLREREAAKPRVKQTINPRITAAMLDAFGVELGEQ